MTPPRTDSAMAYEMGKLVVGTILIAFLVGIGIGYALHSMVHRCGERKSRPMWSGNIAPAIRDTNYHMVEVREQSSNMTVTYIDGKPYATSIYAIRERKEQK